MAVCETAGQQLYLHVCCLVSMCVKFCTPTTCTSGARALKMPDMEKWDAIFSYANEDVRGFWTAGPPSYLLDPLLIHMCVEFRAPAMCTFGAGVNRVLAMVKIKFIWSPFPVMQMRSFVIMKLLVPPPIFRCDCKWVCTSKSALLQCMLLVQERSQCQIFKMW